jgi:hypothetical protein
MSHPHLYFWRHLLSYIVKPCPRRQYSEPILSCGSGGPAFSYLNKQLINQEAGEITMVSSRPLFASGAAGVDSFIDHACLLKIL